MTRLRTPARFGAAGPLPVWDVERALTWCYRDQLGDTGLLRPRGWPPSCLARLELAGVSGGAGATGGHDDALVIEAAVVASLGKGAELALVITHARLAEPPAWWAGDLAIVPRLDARGRPLVLEEREEAYCPIVIHGADAVHAAMRAQYRTWWEAVARVERALGRAPLRTLRVAGFRAPPDPWRALEGRDLDRAGRPCVLSGEKRAAVLRALAAGEPPAQVALKMGVSLRTVQRLRAAPNGGGAGADARPPSATPAELACGVVA